MNKYCPGYTSQSINRAMTERERRSDLTSFRDKRVDELKVIDAKLRQLRYNHDVAVEQLTNTYDVAVEQLTNTKFSLETELDGLSLLLPVKDRIKTTTRIREGWLYLTVKVLPGMKVSWDEVHKYMAKNYGYSRMTSGGGDKFVFVCNKEKGGK